MRKSDLYVIETGCVVKKRGFNFTVNKNNNTMLDIPYSKVDKIILIGSQSITPKALEFALDKEKDVLFLSKSGKLKGSIISNNNKNVFLRLAQYELWRDQAKRLRIAKSIVKGKIVNQYALLKRYSIDICVNKERVVSKLEDVSELNQLLGIEGEVGKNYFSNFDSIISGELSFEKRSRFPPKNEVNALLSLTYTMVLNNILSELEKGSIDSFIGFVHTVKYGRESLGLDLLEQFRSFCDLVVIKWINRGEFKKRDFILDDEKGIILNELAFRKYIEKFNIAFKELNEVHIPLQVKRFKDCIINEIEYKSYELK